MNTPKQKYFLGDVFRINGNNYTITDAEYAAHGNDKTVVIWYRLHGPVSRYEYEDALDALIENKVAVKQ